MTIGRCVNTFICDFPTESGGAAEMQKRIDELTIEVAHLTKLCDWLLLHVTVLDKAVLGETYMQDEPAAAATAAAPVIKHEDEQEEEEGLVTTRKRSRSRSRSRSPRPVRKRSPSPRGRRNNNVSPRPVRKRSRSPDQVKRNSRDDGRSVYIRWKDNANAPQFKNRDSQEWRRGVAEIADNLTSYVTRKQIFRIWLWNATPSLVLARVSLHDEKDFKIILADDKGLQTRCGYQFSTTPWGLGN